MILQGRNLKEGLSGADVADLQAELAKLEYAIPPVEQQAAKFDAETLAAVKAFQTTQNLRSTGEVDEITVEALSKIIAASTYLVAGNVSSPVSASVGVLTVQLLDKNIGQDVDLASTWTATNGDYTISIFISPAYLERHKKKQPDLQVTVAAAGAAAVLGQSAVQYNAGNTTRLDVTLPAATAGLPSEYETLTAALAAHYSGRLAELQETAARQDITYLANKTGFDARMVAMAAAADTLNQISMTKVGGRPASLQAAFCYALLRAGAPTDAAQLFRMSPAAAAAVWTKAIAQSVIPANLQPGIAGATKVFQKLAGSQLLTATVAGVSTLAEQLAPVLTDSAQQQQFAELLLQYSGDWTTFWSKAGKALGAATTAKLQVLGKLHYLTLNNAPLVTELLKAVPDVATAPQTLVSAGYYEAAKWTPIIAGSVPAGLQEADYAAYLAAQVKLAFPTAVLADQISTAAMPLTAPPAVVTEVAKFLAANQAQFGIGSEPVEAFLARSRVAAPSGVALDQIKRLQRTYQLTTSDANMAVLLNHRLDSAFAITRYDEPGFIRALGPQLGGADTARALHRRARQVFGTVLNLATSYGVAMRGPANGAALKLNDNSGNLPAATLGASATLQQLFGSMDYCNCSDCNSILSAAAYFVDLLHYLDQPAPSAGFMDPQALLFERRPDLQYLALSCENTNTALPYIDIVNETLEAFVAGDASLAGFEGFNTSATVSSAELIAAPQNVNNAAYAVLQSGFFPSPLPFNRPLALLRQHLTALGVALPDAMIALRDSDAIINNAQPGDYGWSDILIEQLGISRDEYRIFTDTTLGLGQLYGLPNATALTILQTTNLQTFSLRLGVDYDDLVAILQTQFINPGAALIERLQALGVSFAAIQALQANPEGAAAFIAGLPAGLDYSQYGGSDGQAVVNWLTGPNYAMIMGMITITNPNGGADNCSGTALQFRYAKPDSSPGMTASVLSGTDFLKLLRFIRLWSKLQALLQIDDDGDAITATDALLCALYPSAQLPVNSGNAANDGTNLQRLDAGFATLLLRAGFAMQLLNRLSLDWNSLTQLLACWADIGAAGADSLYGSMFLTPTLLQQDPGAQAGIISLTVNTNDQLTTTINTVPVVYAVTIADTPSSVASNVAAAINGTVAVEPVSGKPLNQRFRAKVSAANDLQVVILAGFIISQWGVTGAGGTLAAAAVADPTLQSANVGGVPAVGQNFSVTIDGIQITYTAQAGDTPATVASNLAAAINGTSTAHPYSGLPLNMLLSAQPNGNQVTVATADAGPPFDLACSIALAINTNPGNAAAYVAGPAVPARAVLTLSGAVTTGNVVTLTLNSVSVTYTVAATDNSLAVLAGSLAGAINNAVQTDPTTGLAFGALLHAAGNGAQVTVSPIDPSTGFTIAASSNGTEKFAVAEPNPATQTATVTGTFPVNAVLTTTLNGVSYFYTATAGNSPASIASNFAIQINAPGPTDPSTGLPLNQLVAASAAGGTLTVTAANPTVSFTLTVAAAQGSYTAGHLNPPFADNGYGLYLQDNSQTLLGHQPMLCAACNLTGAEFALITADLGFTAGTPLTLDNVSQLFRRGWLAHALGISVLEFLTLRKYSGLDPFALLDPAAASPAEPPAIRFLRLVQALQSAGLPVIQALYLLWNQDPSGTLTPGADAVAALALALRADFASIAARFTVQDDPSGSIAQQLMTLVYGAADTGFFFGLLNQNIGISVTYSYGSPVLPLTVLNAANGLLAYDDNAKTLTISGLLSANTAAAITAAAAVNTTDATDNAPAGQVTLTPVSMTNIVAGAVLLVDSGAAQESVAVGTVGTAQTSFTTTTAKAHNGTVTAFTIVNDPSLPAAITALVTASQQAAAPFFARYPELQTLYSAYIGSSASVQTRRNAFLASILPTLIQLRNVQQALSDITAQLGCDPSFAPALLQDAVILHAHAEPALPAIDDLLAIQTGGLGAAFYPGNDPTQPPDQTGTPSQVFYVQTATLGGTPSLNATITTTINGQAVNYIVQATDTTLSGLAAQIAAGINASNLIDPASQQKLSQLVSAAAAGPVLSLTPAQPFGVAGLFTLACASAAAGLTYVAGTQLPAGGAAGIAASWTGFITPPQSGNIDICVLADSGASVNLAIGGANVSMGASGGVFGNLVAVPLTVNLLTPIALTVGSMKTAVALGWRTAPGLAWTVIPATALFPNIAMASLSATYTRFLKAVSLAGALSLTAPEIAWAGTDTSKTVETSCPAATAPGSHSFQLASMANIGVGSRLILDQGSARETVTVTAIGPGSFTATAANAHAGTVSAPFPIVSIAQPALNRGWLNSLPGAPDSNPAKPKPDLATAAKLTPILQALLDFARVKQALSPADERFLAVLQAPSGTLGNGQSALLSLTGWALLSVNTLTTRFFGDPALAHLGGITPFAQLFDAMTLVQSCRVTAPALLPAISNAPTPVVVSGLQSTLRAFYAARDWLTVVQPISDALRIQCRDALVAWSLQYFLLQPGNTIQTADDLYALFLIDPLTQPAVQTSRIRLALSAVQLFIERIIGALEPKASPADVDAQQWAWMKRYRVWQANREVFLWPENWLYPELRDDESPIFQQVMSALLQSDITDDAATSAYLDYLSDLADVAKLEPCGMYYVPATADADEISYVVSGNFGTQSKYYFRKLQNAAWTPWDVVPIDCEDMPLTPIVWGGRLFLFWLKIHKISPVTLTRKPKAKLATKLTDATLDDLRDAGPNTAVSELTIQATLYWIEYYNGAWQTPKSSDPKRPTTIGCFPPSGAKSFDVYRNLVRIVPATCTGANPWPLPPNTTLPPIPPDALVLVISTPSIPFPTQGQPLDKHGSGFLMHNTHSVPTRLEDVPTSSGGIISAYLDYPSGIREISPPGMLNSDSTAYAGGPASGSLTLGYFEPSSGNSAGTNLIANTPQFSVSLLQYSWAPRIVDAQPILVDAQSATYNPRTAPFMYEDRRNLFYVTTVLNQYTFILWKGFGLGDIPVKTQQPQIPPLRFGGPDPIQGITVTLPGNAPIVYRGSQITEIGGLVGLAAAPASNAD